MANPLQEFLSDQQDPEVVRKVHERVTEILMRDEEIIYIATQKSLTSLSPDSAVLTTRRFIIYRPKLLGGVSFEDYRWLDLKDARVKEGMINATLSFTTTEGRKLEMENLPKAQARKLYGFAQEMEEKSHGQRRERDLEEKRAAAGGVQFNAMPFGQPTFAPSAGPAVAAEDPLERLTKLKKMLDAGLIDQGEFDTKKKELLAAM